MTAVCVVVFATCLITSLAAQIKITANRKTGFSIWEYWVWVHYCTFRKVTLLQCVFSDVEIAWFKINRVCWIGMTLSFFGALFFGSQ